jgi:DNA-binding CsgD family transcriptional regulator
MRALTRREIDVLTMAARGIATKLIAYGLGMSPPAVSSSLARAASKLGLSSRLELVRLAATITADPRANAQAATVTAAESEILELLRQGLSNRDIARLRSRSVHTIANQVASLLRKMNSASRRNLALRPA